MNEHFFDLMELLINNLEFPFSILSAKEYEFRYVYSNCASNELDGTTSERFGKRVEDIHSPDFAAYLIELYKNAIQSKQTITNHHPYHLSTGKVIETTLVIPLPSADGCFSYLLCVHKHETGQGAASNEIEEFIELISVSKSRFVMMLRDCEHLFRKCSSRAGMDESLQKAIDEDQFILHFQPQIDLKQNTCIGVETLIRWNHPEKGMIPPLQFIPYAEESGAIIPMTEWVLYHACEQFRRWQNDRFTPRKIAVNITASHFQEDSLVDLISDVLAYSTMPPEFLELEITESVVMHDIKKTIEILTVLKSMGVKIALDDFGTGASSLTYLKHLPIDVLKIDKSFIDGIPINQKDSIIVDVILKLGHHLNLEIVAEGIENAQQANYLIDSGCDIGQGYLFAKPLSQQQLVKWIHERQT